MDIYWDVLTPEIKGVFICRKATWRVKAALRACGSGLRPVAQSADKVCVCVFFLQDILSFSV